MRVRWLLVCVWYSHFLCSRGCGCSKWMKNQKPFERIFLLIAGHMSCSNAEQMLERAGAWLGRRVDYRVDQFGK